LLVAAQKGLAHRRVKGGKRISEFTQELLLGQQPNYQRRKWGQRWNSRTRRKAKGREGGSYRALGKRERNFQP